MSRYITTTGAESNALDAAASRIERVLERWPRQGVFTMTRDGAADLAELLRAISVDCGDGTTVCTCVPVAERMAERSMSIAIEARQAGEVT